MDNNDLKKVIQREYLKCAEDPVHFMRKYCTIQHPKKGKVKFDLYPFQEKSLREFKDKPLPNAEEARILIDRVKLGEDADAVVTEFYLDKENQSIKL